MIVLQQQFHKMDEARGAISFCGNESQAVLKIPKCATRSMLSSVENIKGSGWRNIPDIPISAFIRDPLERLKSAFSFFAPRSRVSHAPKEWTGFVDYILKGKEDKHWIPQTGFLAWVPKVNIYPFERISEVWENLGFGELPRVNQSQNFPIPKYREEDLKEWFASDYEVRKWL